MWFSAAESKLDVRIQSCGHSKHRHTAMGCGPQQLAHKVPVGSSCSAAGEGWLSAPYILKHAAVESVLAVLVADRHTRFGHSAGAKETGTTVRSSTFLSTSNLLTQRSKASLVLVRLSFRQRNLTCLQAGQYCLIRLTIAKRRDWFQLRSSKQHSLIRHSCPSLEMCTPWGQQMGQETTWLLPSFENKALQMFLIS